MGPRPNPWVAAAGALAVGLAAAASGCGALSGAERDTLASLERQVDEIDRQRIADARRLDDAMRRLAVIEALTPAPGVAAGEVGGCGEFGEPAPPTLPVVRIGPDSVTGVTSVAESNPTRVAPASVTIESAGEQAGDPVEGALDDRAYEGPGFGNDPGQGYLDLRSAATAVRLISPPRRAVATPQPPPGPVTPQGGTPSSAFGYVPRLPMTTAPQAAAPSFEVAATPPPEPAQPARASPYVIAMEAYRGRRWNEAASLFDVAIAQGLAEPERAQATFLRAEAAFQAGDYLDAIGSFERLVSRYPGSPRIPDALNRIGMASERIGDAERAVEVYRQVVDRFAGSRAAETAAGRLERLEGGM